jgi:hypothetical protein
LQKRTDAWVAAGDSATVSSKLLEAARQLGGRVQADSGGLIEVKFGSRFHYRMLGAWSKPKTRPLVLRLKIRPESRITAEVQAETLSDPGWYATAALMNSFGRDKHFEEAFRRIFDGLRSAAPAVAEA